MKAKKHNLRFQNFFEEFEKLNMKYTEPNHLVEDPNGKTDEMAIYDDELVVNYNKKVVGGLGTDAQDLINKLMRKVTRRIPYTSR